MGGGSGAHVELRCCSGLQVWLKCVYSLAVQWLGLRTFAAEGMSLIPGQGTKIPQAAKRSKKKKCVCWGGLRGGADADGGVEGPHSPR